MEYRYASHTVFHIESGRSGQAQQTRQTTIFDGSAALDPSYFYQRIPLSPSLTMISRWSPSKTRRSVDAYPDFQSVTPTHRL